MRLVTIIENLVYQQGLYAEHGLSIYIETENSKIVFDTGQSGLFLQNALKMDLNIEDVDALILSHGHYDHTGGLYPFLEKNKKARIYAKKDVFKPKYRSHNRFIGTIFQSELLQDRLQFVDEITEIAENIFIMPNIELYNKIDTHFNGLNLKMGEEYFPDEFEDELFLAIRQKEQINIITACSHRGITNICRTATEHFKLPAGLILGGFHMKDCNQEQYIDITRHLRQLQPKSIGVCHCTGVEKYSDMAKDCDAHLFYNYTGKEIFLN